MLPFSLEVYQRRHDLGPPHVQPPLVAATETAPLRNLYNLEEGSLQPLANHMPCSCLRDKGTGTVLLAITITMTMMTRFRTMKMTKKMSLDFPALRVCVRGRIKAFSRFQPGQITRMGQLIGT